MIRTKAYYREMRKKHIMRKKKLSSNYWHYKYDGQYSKGKIHCSCSLCSHKTNSKSLKRTGPTMNWKHADLVNIQSMDNDIKEYLFSA